MALWMRRIEQLHTGASGAQGMTRSRRHGQVLDCHGGFAGQLVAKC